MKKGKLQKNGKGWIIISTEFKTGSMSVQGDYQLTDDMNDKEIEFDNSGGYIKEIYYLNKLYTKLVQKQRAQTEQNNTVDQRDKRYSQNINNMKAEKYKIKCENGTWKYFDKENNKWENFKYSLNIEPLEKEQEVMFFWIESGNDIQLKYIELFGVKLEYGKYRDKNARAPYNFVPLNNKVVLCEKAQSEIFNGYINYSFFTKTLLANRASKDKFLIVNDKVIFPGSSFRGMVKNILEIVSYGKIETNIKNTCHFRITDHNPKSEIIDIPIQNAIIHNMKKGIHPKNNLITVTCACGNKFETMSILEKIVTDTCSQCHPFFTGKATFVDAEGRIDKFNRKKNLATQTVKNKESKKEENSTSNYKQSLKDIFNQAAN